MKRQSPKTGSQGKRKVIKLPQGKRVDHQGGERYGKSGSPFPKNEISRKEGRDDTGQGTFQAFTTEKGRA